MLHATHIHPLNSHLDDWGTCFLPGLGWRHLQWPHSLEKAARVRDVEDWLREPVVKRPVNAEHAARKGGGWQCLGHGCFVTEDNNHQKGIWCNDEPLLAVDGKLNKGSTYRPL